MRCGVWRGLAVLVAVTMLAGCSLTRRRQPSVYDALQARRLMVPVSGVAPAQLDDTFNASRDHGRRKHLALDIMAPHGTPVLAADDGEIIAVKTNHLGGRVIYATDPDRRFVYHYAHLSRSHPGTVPGRRVARGDVLGYVGSTGNASPRAPHLHFQVRMYASDGRYWTGRPSEGEERGHVRVRTFCHPSQKRAFMAAILRSRASTMWRTLAASSWPAPRPAWPSPRKRRSDIVIGALRAMDVPVKTSSLRKSAAGSSLTRLAASRGKRRSGHDFGSMPDAAPRSSHRRKSGVSVRVAAAS